MISLHERAKDVFLAALELPGAERERFVAERCGTDTALHAEVLSLLKFHEETGGSPLSGAPDTTGHPDSRAGDAAPRVGVSGFNPGDVFAGRYRMVTRLGKGGMGDVWRADDLVLETPVALKLIHSTGSASRAQIINEVRLARQITHPSVCRVFDVGDDDGIVFFSMELVQGEDLSTLLRRAGRLPAERVLDIARQLCAGLTAAHAQGVLHRDLKPANVLVDNHGRVLITDFGIAITRDDGPQQSLIGTPGYMAPEQLTPGAALTERTDVYALGLILYELVVGQHPFSNRISRTPAPTEPSVKVPDIDPRLERVIMRALQPKPADRPPSAAAMGESLADAPIESARSKRLWYAGVAVAAAMVVVAIGAAFLIPRERSQLTAQDTIILSDFVNTTGDPVFTGTLKVALAVALEQSPFLKIFPEGRMRETLGLMGKPPDAAVTREVAREIAEREQVKALLTGSISGLGRNFVLLIEAVNAVTGDVMAREQVEARSKEEVLSALGGAAARLREKLGEALASVQKFDVPLARATTSSLDALHAYSLALDEGSINPRLEMIPHLQRAIELDPDFALAMALLATAYANTGQGALAAPYAKRAFDLRDRVSERERYFISHRYYRDALQNWEEALALSRRWTVSYPREAFAFNSLGQALQRFGHYDESVEPFRESIRLDPHFQAPYANLAASLLALGRDEELTSLLADADRQQLSSSQVQQMRFVVAFVRGDTVTMSSVLQASVGVGRTNVAYGWNGHSLAVQGRFEEAHEQFQAGSKVAAGNGLREVAGQLSAEDAESHATVGDCARARSEAANGLQLSRDSFTLEIASRAFALCRRDGEATALVRELRDRFPEATLIMRVLVPATEAILATHQSAPRHALEILEPVRPYDRSSRAEFWPEYLRGQTYLQLGDAASAAAQFQSVIDHHNETPTSVLYPLSRLGLARARVKQGDTAHAREAYEQFLADWSRADPGLPMISDARQELARLN